MSHSDVLMPYALSNESGCIVSIQEVQQGNQCHCRCLACKTPVTARHGEINQWHFAHRTDQAFTEQECRYSPVTALALILRQQLPDIAAMQVNGRRYDGLHWETETSAYGVVIDMLGRTSDGDTTIALEVPFANGVGLPLEILSTHVDIILSIDTEKMANALQLSSNAPVIRTPTEIYAWLLASWDDWVTVVSAPPWEHPDPELANNPPLQKETGLSPSLLCRCCQTSPATRGDAMFCDRCVFLHVGREFNSLTEMMSFYRHR